MHGAVGLVRQGPTNHNAGASQSVPSNPNNVESLSGLIERVTFFNEDIHGIGFKTADQIAQKVGIPHDSVLRAQPCVTRSHQ